MRNPQHEVQAAGNVAAVLEVYSVASMAELALWEPCLVLVTSELGTPSRAELKGACHLVATLQVALRRVALGLAFVLGVAKTYLNTRVDLQRQARRQATANETSSRASSTDLERESFLV